MIDPRKLEELAPLYEEYMYAEDPVGGLQARLIFDSICRAIYMEESEDMRAKLHARFSWLARLFPNFSHI